MELLVRNLNATLPDLCAARTASVNFDGTLFDCDFNQQLGLHLRNKIAVIISSRCLSSTLTPWIDLNKSQSFDCTALDAAQEWGPAETDLLEWSNNRVYVCDGIAVYCLQVSFARDNTHPQ